MSGTALACPMRAGGDGSTSGGSNTSWAVARGLSSGDANTPAATGFWSPYVDNNAGSGFTYYIRRGHLPADISGIPANALVLTADLVVKISGANHYSLAGGAVAIVESLAASPTALANSDFSLFGSTEWATRQNFSGFSDNQVLTFSLNSTGIAALQAKVDAAATSFQMGMRASHDLDNSAPSNTNYSAIFIFSQDHATSGNRPVLNITYAVIAAGAADTLSEGVGDVGVVSPEVAVTGAGDTLSEGVGVAKAAQVWDFDYMPLVVPVTGAGDTLSEGVGVAGHPQVWDFDYYTGLAYSQGYGDTLSQGVGAVSVVGPATWYTITGSALPAPPAAGAGDTLSQGIGAVGALDSLAVVTGYGETLSQGGSATLGIVVPSGGIRLEPYWEPGELVYCYRLTEWLGSYEARLGAGPGPVTQTEYADVQSTVTFYGLDPGQYVAVLGRKRVHFMVTE